MSIHSGRFHHSYRNRDDEFSGGFISAQACKQGEPGKMITLVDDMAGNVSVKSWRILLMDIRSD